MPALNLIGTTGIFHFCKIGTASARPLGGHQRTELLPLSLHFRVMGCKQKNVPVLDTVSGET